MGTVVKETDLNLLRQVLQPCGVHNQEKIRRERAYNESDGPNSSRSSLMSNSSECERIRQDNKRDRSMREAIQHHITDLVKSLLFKECDIPDLIIVHRIANENDAAMIRQLSTTEDQVSALVSHVIDCDYNGMDSFLKMITEDYSQLEKKIRDMFDTIHNDIDEDEMPCAKCELKARCNVKHVYNYLFEKQMISHVMHRSIAYEKYPLENMAGYWDKVLKELSYYPNQLAIGVLIQAFDQHDGHSNATIKLMLKRLFRKNRPLTCKCNNAPSLSSSPESVNEDMATDIASNRDNQGMDTDIDCIRDNQNMETNIASNCDNQDMAIGIVNNSGNQDIASGIAKIRDSLDLELQQAKKASEIPDQSQTQYPAYAPVEALSATDKRLAHDGKHFLLVSNSNSMAQKLESPPMGRVSDMDSDMKYDNVSTNFKEAGQSERKEKKFSRKPHDIRKMKEKSQREWKGKENLSQ